MTWRSPWREGGGAGLAPLERRPLPVTDPELLRCDARHRRPGRPVQLREPGHQPSCSGSDPRSSSADRPPTSSTPTTRSASGAVGAQLQAGAETRTRSSSGWSGRTAVGAMSRRSSPTSCDRPSVGGYVANVRDITERKEFEALLAHRALHDPLTGLANRQLILDRAEQMLARARRTCDPVAAYFIDLDNFKDANDSLGHEAGDKLLQAVAGRFARPVAGQRHRGPAGGGRVRDPGRGRLHVDRPGNGRRTDPRSAAGAVPRRGVRGPAHLDHRQHRDRHGRPVSAQELLRDADIALYRAKAAGRDGLGRCSSRPCSPPRVDRLELKSDLDSALARRPVLPPLPTDLRSRQRSSPGRGGADPLAAPDQGDRHSRRRSFRSSRTAG